MILASARCRSRQRQFKIPKGILNGKDYQRSAIVASNSFSPLTLSFTLANSRPHGRLGSSSHPSSGLGRILLRSRPPAGGRERHQRIPHQGGQDQVQSDMALRLGSLECPALLGPFVLAAQRGAFIRPTAPRMVALFPKRFRVLIQHHPYESSPRLNKKKFFRL